MWLNSRQREEPYLGLTLRDRCGDTPFLRDTKTGAAWLSSARAVRCSVKSGNERNPCRQLPAGNAGHSGETARVKREEGADDVKSVWPLHPGLHTCYNGRYSGKQYREVERILKTAPSSDWSLQLDSMKLESLVKAYQQRRLEYVPGPCTHRPSHHGSRLHPKRLLRGSKVCPVTGMKS
jgi:hypothetical protein